MKNTIVKNLPAGERPYERFKECGVQALSNAELLAIIIKNGYKDFSVIDVARELLSEGDLRSIGKMEIAELQKIKGIGKVKAMQILCVFELAKRIAGEKYIEKEKLDNPARIAEMYMPAMSFYKQEHMMLLLLDIKLHLIKDMIISKGTVDSTILSPREIFSYATKYDAAHILLIHNHPSGDPTPSPEDMVVTDRMRDCGELMGIDLLDHIIIGQGVYFSFKNEELL